MEPKHHNTALPDSRLLINILDHTPVGLMVLTLLDEVRLEFGLVQVNEHNVKVTGVDLKPFIGKTLREALPDMYDQGTELPNACLNVLKTGKPVRIGAKESGRYTHFVHQYPEVKCLPMDDAYVLVMAEHFTQVQSAGNELELANEKIAALEAELHSNRKELTEFIYAVSHDLRAPIRHIESYSGWIIEDEGENLSADGCVQMEKVVQSAKRLSSMVEDLVQYFRNYQLSPKKVLTDLNPLVAEVQAACLREMPDAIGWQWVVVPLPTLAADPEMMRTVFKNLLSNAIKFMAATEDPCIRIEVEEQESECIFSIVDNGVGFDIEYAHKLFTIFQRLHVRSEFTGNGLGLANARRIIEVHGGRIWAEGEVDKGATFYFSLPKEEV